MNLAGVHDLLAPFLPLRNHSYRFCASRPPLSCTPQLPSERFFAAHGDIWPVHLALTLFCTFVILPFLCSHAPAPFERMALLETSPAKTTASAPAPAGETQARRVAWIDGLRGLAVLIVLLYHHWGFAGFNELRLGPLNFADLFENGVHGVHIFFVISGFCLAWPFSGPTGKSPAQLALWPFLQHRFARLARPYYVVLFLSALPVFAAAYVKTGLLPADLWWNLLAHGFFVHNLWVEYTSSFNMALWTLALQFQFYLFFPLLLLLRSRTGPLRLALIVGGAELLYRLAVWSLASGDWQLNYALAYTPPGRLFEFACGMVMAGLIRDRSLDLASRRTRGLCLLVCLVTGCAAYLLSRAYGRLYPAVDLLWALFVSAALALGFAPGLWRRLLENRLLAFCGVCSYSIFLVHHPIGSWLHHHFYFEDRFPLLLRQTVMLAYVPLMIGAGRVGHLLLEKPAVRKPAAARSCASKAQENPASP